MTPREPSPKYVALMNARYERILDTAYPGAALSLSYDGGQWTASIAVRPAGRERWVRGSGLTIDYALAALEDELGLSKWQG